MADVIVVCTTFMVVAICIAVLLAKPMDMQLLPYSELPKQRKVLDVVCGLCIYIAYILLAVILSLIPHLQPLIAATTILLAILLASRRALRVGMYDGVFQFFAKRHV